MDNVNFQPSGEEIERALMDLGPLLGVTIKEEVHEDLPDINVQPSAQLIVGSLPDAAAGSAGTSSNREGGGDIAEGHDKGTADSLASPTAGRVPLASVRCVMCQGTLAHSEGTPKLMECLHSACEPCIKTKIEEKQAASRDFLGVDRITITCPVCRLQCQPANMIDQRFVIEKLAVEQVGANGVSGEQQCNSCEDTEPATSYCVDCAEFICENCVHAHQRLKITKDHTIKTKEEAVAELQAAQTSSHNAHDMYCVEHTQERLTLFCETCDRLTCRDCQLQHHRDHKYQFSTEMAAHARANISSLLSEVSYKRVLLGSAMKVIKDRQQLIADKKKALVHEITQTVVRLTNAINTRGKQLVLRLNEVCDAKQRTLSEKKDALEQLAAITDHCVEFVNAALEQGSDTALLYAKHSVCAHLLRIKSRRADIPNPEIPVRINLALDKLPDLLRVLSSMGAIVVDGKVDGGSSGAGAQGPYHQASAPPSHPAPPVPPPHSPANPNNSAVVALQHVAMHQQSYGGGGMGGGGTGYGQVTQLRGRAHTPHTPLRHPHVTSTTHPHHLHGMNEMNLRGLLNAASQRGASPVRPQHQVHPQHSAQVAMHHAYQQMMGAYATNAYAVAAGVSNACGGRRSGGPRTPSPAPAPAPAPQPAQVHAGHPAQFSLHHQPPAKWHIPQHSLTNGTGGFEHSMMTTNQNSGGSDYKITLSRPAGSGGTVARTHCAPPAVTSTNPKTPSPSLNGGASSELDKVCAESVQDLMATIAKLDSNGVQVVAEHSGDMRDLSTEPVPSPAPHVHSSTDSDLHAGKNQGSVMNTSSVAGVGAVAGAGGLAVTTGASDPNEDWCAVCMDGGELMCCDKCPKVFHQYCHIPTIEKLPDETETWQCLLCVNFAMIPCTVADEEVPPGGGLSPRLQKLVERLTLELYCQYELSLPFREPVPPENLHYHSKISRPMCLDMIRLKLQPQSPARYTHAAQFVSDCRLLFRNAYRYNPVETQVYKDAKRLEEFFDAQLLKWLPEYAYWSGEGDPPAKRARLE